MADRVLIRPLAAPLGAEVCRLALSEPLCPETLIGLHRALLQHQVLIFSDQHLNDEQHLEFSRHWGELQLHVLDQYRHSGRPEILWITNLDPDGKPKGEHPDPGAAVWHSDGSWSKERGLVTFLHSLRIPVAGGDTLYADMYAAYEGLPADDKHRIDGLVAVHDLDYSRSQTNARKQMTEEQKRAAPPVEWPVVRTHPETGRKCLYLGQHASHVKGIALEEGRVLIRRLNAHATQPKYLYRHVWRQHQLVMWDNRAVLHSATDFDWVNDVRIIRRTTTVGERLPVHAASRDAPGSRAAD
ncbi:MAG TPA: TauD/TfdA family dioxygenase [Burkholderiales bacterium]|nr:TauD/TfdA family dioxygenase [Burkholderiales bacterium]